MAISGTLIGGVVVLEAQVSASEHLGIGVVDAGMKVFQAERSFYFIDDVFSSFPVKKFRRLFTWNHKLKASEE